MSLQKCTVIYDGKPLIGPADMPLIPFLEHCNVKLPHVCYHPALDPLQTCDVCWVESEGELVRGCTLRSREGMVINSANEPARAAREEGMDRLLAKHELYCTVCEHNTGDCTLHNTVVDMHIPIQRYAFERKPYVKDHSNPFYTYDPDQCILCGRCVDACQNVEVNETLSIDYTMEHPRVLWALRHGLPLQCANGEEHAARRWAIHLDAPVAEAPADRHYQNPRELHRGGDYLRRFGD